MNVILMSVMSYSKQIDIWEDTDGFTELAPFADSCRGFFNHLGASVTLDQFWGDNEGQKLATRFVGYNITVTFQGEYSYVSRGIDAASFFFDLNDAVKTKEKLELVKESDSET